MPAWRTHRERHRQGPGKTDPGDAISIAQVVLRKRSDLGPALEPEIVRAFGMLELQRRRFVRDRTQAIQRLRADWTQFDPVSETRVIRCDRQRELTRLKLAARRGPGRAHRLPVASASSPRDIEDLNKRIKALDTEIAELLQEHGNPLADPQGAGTNLAATIIAQAGDVRRFRDAGAFARFCGAAPAYTRREPPAERSALPDRDRAGQTPSASPRLPRPQGLRRQDAQRARRALKRHLANVLYRRLHAWAEQTPAMQT